jgi:hypothetical protein
VVHQGAPEGGLPLGAAGELDLAGIEAPLHGHRRVLLAGHHRLQGDVLVEHLAAPAMNRAHGRTDGRVVVPFQRLAQEVDEAALALEEGEEQQGPLGAELAVVGRRGWGHERRGRLGQLRGWQEGDGFAGEPAMKQHLDEALPSESEPGHGE